MIALTLEDIMKQFDLPRLVSFHHKIDKGAEALRSPSLASTTFDAMESDLLPVLLNDLREYCIKTGFTHAGQKAYALRTTITKNPASITGIELATKLTSIREDIDIGMFHHVYIQVESGVRRYLEPLKLLGDAVVSAFPSALPDIREAGDCVAVGLNDAAVFHLMHIVEWGLRALAAHLGLSRIVIDRKTKKTIPMEYSDWERILNQMRDKVDKKVAAMKRGPKKQEAQQFYYPAFLEVAGFKDAWRNHIMHTRGNYTREDALAVFSHIQRFMQSLADYGIKEV